MPELTRDIILSSWRHSTKNKYASVWARWQRFCLKKGISSTRTSINYVLEFFTNLYTNGCHYSGLCAARSALSSLIHIEEGPSISAHPLTTRFLKGVFNRHPPSPRYVEIWDVDKVLSYFNSKDHNDKLSFKELCYKTVTLLMILGACRKNTLSSFTVEDIKTDDTKCIICPSKVLKHSRPGFKPEPLVFHRYQLNEKLCIVSCIEHYLRQRNKLLPIANNKAFIITFGKPHKPASNDTISRWIKDTLKNSGINIEIFTSHSCRSASTSKAFSLGIPLHEILKRANWSRAETFQKHYNRTIIPADVEDFNYARSILDNHLDNSD